MMYNFIKMIEIIYGKQFTLNRIFVKKIIKREIDEPNDFNFIKYDMDETKFVDVIDDVAAPSLFFDNKVVVMDNINFPIKFSDDDEKNKIMDILENFPDYVHLVLITRTDKLDTKDPIVKLASEKGKITQSIIADKDLPEMIREAFGRHNVKIDNNAIEELIKRVDGDYDRMINECAKLVLLKERININDIILYVQKPLNEKEYELTNALLAGNRALALQIYRDFEVLGRKKVDALAGSLGRQFREYWQISYLDSKGFSEEEIAEQMNLKSGRVWNVLHKNLRGLTYKNITNILDGLYQLDYKVKSGQMDRSYALELFILSFPARNVLFRDSVD